MLSVKMNATYWTVVAMCTRKRKQMMKEVITQTGSTTTREKCIHMILYMYTCREPCSTIFCAS